MYFFSQYCILQSLERSFFTLSYAGWKIQNLSVHLHKYSWYVRTPVHKNQAVGLACQSFFDNERKQIFWVCTCVNRWMHSEMFLLRITNLGFSTFLQPTEDDLTLRQSTNQSLDSNFDGIQHY